MTVEVGATYKNTSKNLVLLVVSVSSLSARCVVVWSNEDVTTAYRAGDMDSWDLKLIEEHWSRL